MRCMICGGKQRHAFRAEVATMGAIAYYRCDGCGFTSAPIYADMTQEQFNDMNARAHAYLGTNENPADPRWRTRLNAQAGLIQRLVGGGAIGDGPAYWLDYACGDGYLADLLGAAKYDRELHPEPPSPDGYNLVISTSAFEHFRSRDELDDCARFVCGRVGALALHTMVRQQIPDDPTWFYLLPGHCSLFTNRAMQHLFSAWGYRACSYYAYARMWLWWYSPLSLSLALETHTPEKGVHGTRFIDYWKD